MLIINDLDPPKCQLYYDAKDAFTRDYKYSDNDAHDFAFAYALNAANAGVTLMKKGENDLGFRALYTDKDPTIPGKYQFSPNDGCGAYIDAPVSPPDPNVNPQAAPRKK